MSPQSLRYEPYGLFLMNRFTSFLTHYEHEICLLINTFKIFIIKKMKSAILAQKINQIQKKNEAAEEKKTEEKQRSTYKALESTLRMVNPFSVFKVMLVHIEFHGLIRFLDWNDKGM